MIEAVREYQTQAIHDLRSAFRKSRCVLYQLPTGGGKTVVAGKLARLIQKDRRVLVLAHRREICKQFHNTLLEHDVTDTSYLMSGEPICLDRQFQIGMVQTVIRRIEKYNIDPDLIIVDEAHHAAASTYRKIMEAMPHTRILGLTATPTRLDGKGLDFLFESMVCGPQIAELVQDGYLAETILIAEDQGTVVSKIMGGDYDIKEQAEQVDEYTVASAVEAYQKHVLNGDYPTNGKAIFFGIDRRHTQWVADEFNENGISAVYIDGDMPIEKRDMATEQFAKIQGGASVLCNVDIVSEGYDVPICDVVMIGRKTKSVARYLQMAGRCMRPHVKWDGRKKQALVIDLTGSYAEPGLGHPMDYRDWHLGGRTPGEDKRLRTALSYDPLKMLKGLLVPPKYSHRETYMKVISQEEAKQFSENPRDRRSKRTKNWTQKRIWREFFRLDALARSNEGSFERMNYEPIKALIAELGWSENYIYIVKKRLEQARTGSK